MPGPIIAAAALSAGASLIGANQSASAASAASEAQTASAQAGIDEQRRQFDTIQQNLSPFIEAGGQGLAGQLALLGQSGQAAQAQAISDIEGGAGFQALIAQGENAMLQNASATGGLRGGNTQAALAQFRPAMLQQAIDSQYQRLGGLASSGQSSAAMSGQAGQSSANSISNLLQQQGAATAGGALAGAAAFNQGLSGITNAAGYALSNPGVQQSLFGQAPSFSATPDFNGLY